MKKRSIMGRVSKMYKKYKCPDCGAGVILTLTRRKNRPWPPPPEAWPPIGGQCRNCLRKPYLPIDENEN